VMLNAMDGPSTERSTSLRNLLRYKAFVTPLGAGSSSLQIDDELQLFGRWSGECNCNGERDPRALPLHTFSPDREWSDLHLDAGKHSFARVHGSSGSWVDTVGRPWNKARYPHGRGESWVAGAVLDGGAHWDVQAARSTTSICNLHQVWRVPRGSYVNVYPDGHIRKGQSAVVSAVMIHEETRPSSLIQMAKPPPRRRRGRRSGRGADLRA
jgi:hypothetical protein